MEGRTGRPRGREDGQMERDYAAVGRSIGEGVGDGC